VDRRILRAVREWIRPVQTQHTVLREVLTGRQAKEKNTHV
jgi:hypothetical protein